MINERSPCRSAYQSPTSFDGLMDRIQVLSRFKVCYEKLYRVTFKRDILEASQEFVVFFILGSCVSVSKAVYFVICLLLDYLECSRTLL